MIEWRRNKVQQLLVQGHRQVNTGKKLADPSIRKLFEGKDFVFVSTLMKPRITPTWVHLAYSQQKSFYTWHQ
jgi:hypothetical protein